MSRRTFDQRGLRVRDDHHLEADPSAPYKRIAVETLNRRIAVETDTFRFVLTYETLDIRERHPTHGQRIVMPWSQVYEALAAWHSRAAPLDDRRRLEEALERIASGQLSKSEAKKVARKALGHPDVDPTA